MMFYDKTEVLNIGRMILSRTKMSTICGFDLVLLKPRRMYQAKSLILHSVCIRHLIGLMELQ